MNNAVLDAIWTLLRADIDNRLSGGKARNGHLRHERHRGVDSEAAQQNIPALKQHKRNGLSVKEEKYTGCIYRNIRRSNNRKHYTMRIALVMIRYVELHFASNRHRKPILSRLEADRSASFSRNLCDCSAEGT